MFPPYTDDSVLTATDQFSILTGSNSTESGRLGLGSSFDRLLSRSAKRFDRFLGRLSEVLGFGPNAVVKRIMRRAASRALLASAHRHRCRHEDTMAELLSGLRRKHTFQDIVSLLLCSPVLACSKCRSVFISCLVAEDSIRLCCLGLRKCLKYVTYLSRLPGYSLTSAPEGPVMRQSKS
jgi:hypothetical protein